MTLTTYEISPLLASLVLIAHVTVGAGIGVLFFRALWWNTRVIVGGGGVASAIALTLSRFALLGGLLTLSALEGAAPLLAASVGVFVGRFLVLRALRSDER